MVCLRNISVDTLHKGDTEDNNNKEVRDGWGRSEFMLNSNATLPLVLITVCSVNISDPFNNHWL
jgi:hypothetical protein